MLVIKKQVLNILAALFISGQEAEQERCFSRTMRTDNLAGWILPHFVQQQVNTLSGFRTLKRNCAGHPKFCRKGIDHWGDDTYIDMVHCTPYVFCSYFLTAITPLLLRQDAGSAGDTSAVFV